MVETKLLLAYSFNTPICECVCIYIYIYTQHVYIYTHMSIQTFGGMSICTYSWKMFHICSPMFSTVLEDWNTV